MQEIGGDAQAERGWDIRGSTEALLRSGDEVQAGYEIGRLERSEAEKASGLFFDVGVWFGRLSCLV